MNTKSYTYSTANLTDVELKEQGNSYFTSKNYEDAINCYTKAITKNSNNAVYFTNRALCYLKLKQWNEAARDCRSALEIDNTLVKAHFFLGQCLMELEQFDDSIAYLQRAHDISKEQKQNFGDDITAQIRLARKKKWTDLEEKRILQESIFQSYLTRLIKKDKEEQISDLKEGQSSIEEIEQQYDDNMKELQNIFVKLDKNRKKREVPDYLCGKISFEILRDPCITPSGITYERKNIEEHLERVGHFDPITRVKLTRDQLIPNFSMKEVVDAFINENEWALDY